MAQTAVAAPAAVAAQPVSRLQSPYAVTLLVAALYLGLLGWLWNHFGGDPLGFVHEGTIWRDQNPQGTWGYDGQFYYYTALHPLHAVQFMDLPSIRLQRIFFPMVVEIVALAQRPLIPYATLLVNWLAVVGGTLLVALLLKRWGRSPWFALSYALCSGIPVALTFDTAEPLTFALVALGVLFWERRRAAAPGAQAEIGRPLAVASPACWRSPPPCSRASWPATSRQAMRARRSSAVIGAAWRWPFSRSCP